MSKWVSVCAERTVRDMGSCVLKNGSNPFISVKLPSSMLMVADVREAIDTCLESRLSESVSESSCATDGTEKLKWANLCQCLARESAKKPQCKYSLIRMSLLMTPGTTSALLI